MDESPGVLINRQKPDSEASMILNICYLGIRERFSPRKKLSSIPTPVYISGLTPAFQKHFTFSKQYRTKEL